MWGSFDGSQNQVTQKILACIAPSTARGLQNDRAVGFVSRLHDREDLLQVIDIKSGDTITVFSGMIQQQPHWYERHTLILLGDFRCLRQT